MGQLQQIHSKLVKLGYQILFISPDRPEKIRELTEKSKFDHVILSDSKITAAAAFGVVYLVDNETLALFRGFGIDLEEASGESHNMLPVPSVFIVNKQGVVEFNYVNPDYKVRIDPDLLLAAAKASL